METFESHKIRIGNIRILPGLPSARFALLRNPVFQTGKGFRFGNSRIRKYSDSIKMSSKILFAGIESGFGKSILEYSRTVKYSVLPVPNYRILFDVTHRKRDEIPEDIDLFIFCS